MRSPYGRPGSGRARAVLQFPVHAPSLPSPRRLVRRRPVRPRRRADPDRRHPPAGVDDDVRRVPRAPRPAAVHRRRLPALRRRPAALRRRALVPRLARHHAPRRRPRPTRRARARCAGARQPQERPVPRDPAPRRHRARTRARCGSSTTSPTSGTKVAVVSSSRNAREVLDASGLAPRFEVVTDGIVAAAEHIAGKPAPDMFLNAARAPRRRRRPTPSSSRTPCPASPPGGPATSASSSASTAAPATTPCASTAPTSSSTTSPSCWSAP